MRRKPRSVLDTNVVVSALLWGGKPLDLLTLAEQGQVRLYTNPILLAELKATLAKPKLALAIAASGKSASAHVANYRRLAISMRRAMPQGAWSRDPDDDHVIACALAAKADFVVTGDDDLLSLGTLEAVRIVSPVDLLAILA
jgi:putative PIN family toxin of toxin-antitoxin system